MSVLQTYKRYAHAFFAYVVLYFFLTVYALKLLDLNLLTILFTDNLFLGFFLIFFLLNKLRLYKRQIKNNNFDFWMASPYSKPSYTYYVFSIIKSIISTILYVTFNAGTLGFLIHNLEKINASSFVITLLNVNYILFPIVLIVWEVKRYRYWANIDKEIIAAARSEHAQYADFMSKAVNIEKPKEDGTITGYEPKKLGTLLIQPTSTMKGEPGIGLSGSNFDEYNQKAGALGEVNLAKSFQLHQFLEKFATYWSVQIPSTHTPGPESKSEVDIDCILISKNKIYLIDAKFYSQGNVTWHTTDDGKSIYSLNNNTDNFATPPKRMSKNMTLAQNKIKKKMTTLGIKMDVISYVVMLPTDYGIGKIENIYWPGKIKCLSIVDLISILEKEAPYEAHTEDAKMLDNVFAWLVKDASGKAPRNINF